LLTLKTNKHDQVNYQIFNTDTTEVSKTGDAFVFDIKDYSLRNSALTYIDETSDMTLYLSELNHNGKGSFSAETSALDTHTEANISLAKDSTTYLNNNRLKLDALIGLDLDNDLYTFKENQGYINQLPIAFEGFVKLHEEGQEIDISFTNPESSFKNFLALLPEAYSKNIDAVETTGDFKVNGVIKGMLTDSLIPTFSIAIQSANASFKYPDLPKRVENIVIDTSLKNTTGKAEDTYVDFNTFRFKIDNDEFTLSGTLKNLTDNMLVDAALDGTLNLAHLSEVYPAELTKGLSGILSGNLQTRFDVNAIETNAYERITSSGNLQLTDLVFSSEELNHPMHISRADVAFLPGTVTLKRFDAKTGNSSLTASGTLKNLMGFVLSNNTLQGDFTVTSTHFEVNDFMTPADTTKKSTPGLKIPAFLDCTLHAKAETVVYDNLNLKNVEGTLTLKDQEVRLTNFQSDLFNGKLALDGTVSSRESTPKFNLTLGAKAFDIATSFTDLELFQSLAPIAALLQGTMNTDIVLSGDLTPEFTPKLSSLRGNAYLELLTSAVTPKNEKLLGTLEEKLSFVDFNALDLKDVKTRLDFSDGKVSVAPFTFAYQDIAITVSGEHGFDQALDYRLTLDVPAKYLGSEVNRLIGKINDPEVDAVSIPVQAGISGTFTHPVVNTNLSESVKTLTTKLIEIEKQKLMQAGSNKIKDLLGDLGAPPETSSDTTEASTSAPNVVDEVKNVLGGLLNKNKKQKDSVTTPPK